MSLGRISKLFAAQNASQVVSLLTQLLMPRRPSSCITTA
jgi:hypothetical protein